MHLINFNTHDTYIAEISNIKRPNVALCIDEKKVHYNPLSKQVWVPLISDNKWNVNRYIPIYGVLMCEKSYESWYNRISFTFRKHTLTYKHESDSDYNNCGWNIYFLDNSSADSNLSAALWIDPCTPSYTLRDENGSDSGWTNFSTVGTTIEDINGNIITGYQFPIEDTIYFGRAQKNSAPYNFYVLIDRSNYNPNGYTITPPETIPAI